MDRRPTKGRIRSGSVQADGRVINAQLVCRRCEHQGWDVQSRIVKVDDPQPVQYTGLPYTVPERFRREARCIDREACDDRVDAAQESA